MWTSVIHAFFKHTSSAREGQLLSSRVSSTAPLRVQVDIRVRELELPGFVACLAIVQVLCGLTHHVLELHRLDEFCVPLQIFLVHVIHDLVLARDVLHHNLGFARTCLQVSPLYVFFAVKL